ncbi:Chromosome transmission fidelity protein 18-like protein, partial [Armadillidium nasatum]
MQFASYYITKFLKHSHNNQAVFKASLFAIEAIDGKSNFLIYNLRKLGVEFHVFQLAAVKSPNFKTQKYIKYKDNIYKVLHSNHFTMDGFDVPEDDFEMLYEQEMEMMKEMSAQNAEFEENIPFDLQPNVKRRKTVLPEVGYEIRHTPTIDPDLEMIDRILSHRKAFQANGYESANHSFHRRVPIGDFQSITTDEGSRIYLNVEDEKSFEESIKKVGETKDQVRLLSVPYNDLRIEAENELLTLSPNENEEEKDSGSSEFDEVDLWVNKYRPRNYLDLLSDESTNRTVLHWIKLWDKIVFGYSKLKAKEKQKVLLCGPPGLGKTTLAHIIANHAGYNAVEMNASDDRSVETFKTSLENATTMKSVFANDRRPNCLIIDEIDGAPAASINFLVNLLQVKKTKNEATKKKDKFTLFRPVICICNDLYTPALRPLRQISLVIQFPPTQSTRITTKELKFMDLNGVSVGQKDYQRSLFSVWHSIFTLPRQNNVASQNPHTQKLNSDNSGLGYSKEKNISSKFSGQIQTHTHLEPVVEGLEWAAMTDIFQKEILHNQCWNLGAYIPYSFVAYHFLFASNSWPKLQFPNQYNEFSTKLTKSKSILDSLTSGISAYNLVFSPSDTLIRDILPYLTYIMQPNFRAVNVQLYSNKEREDLSKLVSTMISYNLTYQQEKSHDGTYTYLLEPNVEEVTQFSSISKPKGISYSSKQLIAREIELEKVRRSETYFNSQCQNLPNPPKKNIFNKTTIVSKKELKAPELQTKDKIQDAALPNHLQKLEAKKLKTNQLNVVAKDFFGRVITSTKNEKTNEKNNILSSSIWFKFKEGYSNAVRRPFK